VCLVDPTDVLSLFSQERISAGSIQYPIDNSEMDDVGWACEFACDGPSATIQAPGMLEIKAEELRAVVCATSDLLQDASFNVEGWVIRKAQRAFQQKISAAIMCGDGLGKPMGLLHPSSGIQICDTAPNTNPGEFTWSDLIQVSGCSSRRFTPRGQRI
jgi:HK97 family phage major capsid protein